MRSPRRLKFLRSQWFMRLIVLCLAASCSWMGRGGMPMATSAAPPFRVVYTQHDNVYLLDVASGHRTALTARGGHGGIYYPWYAWSPDGRYLLLVRGRQSATGTDVLLLNQDGTVLRTLASLTTATSVQPAWAADADLIAYVSSSTPSASVPGTVDHLQSLDIQGHRSTPWSFGKPGGCGGGTSDPSQQLEWGETGFGAVAMTFFWSVRRHLAVYTTSQCAGTVDVAETRTGATRQLGAHPAWWHEAAVSPAGVVAAVVAQGRARRIVLTGLTPGAAIQTIGAGELPLWSHDGHTLYFARRTPGTVLHMHDARGNAVESQTYSTAVWRCNADGSGMRRLASFDAFGTGPLAMTPDGRAIVFARVDNSWTLWRHRQAGDRITAALVARFGPRVAVVRLGLDGTLATLAAAAHLPAVQP